MAIYYLKNSVWLCTQATQEAVYITRHSLKSCPETIYLTAVTLSRSNRIYQNKAGERNRTPNARTTKQKLYQLSCTSILKKCVIRGIPVLYRMRLSMLSTRYHLGDKPDTLRYRMQRSICTHSPDSTLLKSNKKGHYQECSGELDSSLKFSSPVFNYPLIQGEHSKNNRSKERSQYIFLLICGLLWVTVKKIKKGSHHLPYIVFRANYFGPSLPLLRLLCPIFRPNIFFPHR